MARRTRIAVVAGLLVFLCGCMPMYPGMPSQVALLHQQGDLSVGVNGGTHGVGAAASIAITDQFGLRLGGGYRPYDNAQNGWGTVGFTSYWLRNRAPDADRPSDGRGLRASVNLDLGGGGGVGRAEYSSYSFYGGSTTTRERYAGKYWLAQVEGDVGYEWQWVAVLGTVRLTYLNYFDARFNGIPGSKFYVEPMVCAQFGPRLIRFELRGGLIFSPAGNAYFHEQPFILSLGAVGNFELGGAPRKAPPPAVEEQGELPDGPPPVPPPEPRQAPPPPPVPVTPTPL